MADGKRPFFIGCQEFTRLTSQSCDEPVGAANRLRMFVHHLLCVYCRRFVAQLRRIRALLAAGGAERAMPAPMREKIHRHLKN